MKRKYGWVRDKIDHRDLRIPRSQSIPDVPLVDLRPTFPECYDQKRLGSCTANGLAAICEFEMKKNGDPEVWTPSRLDIYWKERFVEGSVWQDAGAEIRDGIKVINQWGVCPETMWTYSDDMVKFRLRPTKKCWKESAKHKAMNYAKVDVDEASIKNVLVSGWPIVFGFLVFPGFESKDCSKTGVVPMPLPGENPLGGHCVVLVGYNDSTKMYTVRNSWGTTWGDNGYCYMPYDYIHNQNYCSDFWTVSYVE